MSVAKPAIEIRDLSFAYRSRPEEKVLDGIGVSIAKGEFVGLLGSTGAGKSTLLRCMNGIIPHLLEGVMKGSVRVEGKGTENTGPSGFAGKVGFLFQDPDSQLFAPTVAEEISFGLRNMGVGKDEALARVADALRLVGMDGFQGRDPHELSGGQRQKIAFASVLAMEPEILLLDEPVSALDWRSATDVYNLLRRLNSEGKTIVVVEHNTELLAEYAKRVLVFKGGKIALDASPVEAFSHELMVSLGLKIPCAVKICRVLGVKEAATPEKLAESLRRKR